jgi:hypothetical protein
MTDWRAPITPEEYAAMWSKAAEFVDAILDKGEGHEGGERTAEPVGTPDLLELAPERSRTDQH